MVSWDKICPPKKVGGLGLGKMEAVNSAFLSKLTWKLFHDQGLWVEQIRTKYQIDANFFALKAKKYDFWAWKCILNNWQQFRKGVGRKVGNWVNINFWVDNWCANDSLANLLNIMDLSLIDTSLKVSQFITTTKESDTVQLSLLVDSIHCTVDSCNPYPCQLHFWLCVLGTLWKWSVFH